MSQAPFQALGKALNKQADNLLSEIYANGRDK